AHSDVVLVAEKPKPNPKQKERSIIQELSEVLVLRLSNQKVNPDIKSKVVVHVSKSKETPMKRKRIISTEDGRKKKLKGKFKKEDSDFKLETDVVDSSSDEVDLKSRNNKMTRRVSQRKVRKKMTKKIKKEESDEESVSKKALFKRAEEKLVICSESVLLETLMRKDSSDYPGDRNFIELQEKYVQVFRDPISFDVDVDAGNDCNGDDDRDDDNDNDSDGNGDEEDVNEGDKYPNRSNSSFGFSKISLDDFHNDSGPTQIESVDPTDKKPLLNENVFETHFGKFIVYGVRLNLETLAPSLWLDANVIDCWGTVLNHEESFRAAESKSKHFFPTDCIFKGNKGGLVLGGIDLASFNGFDRHFMPAVLLNSTFYQGSVVRRLRFKFATKILLHEINVHAGKMLELAKEFDKTDPVEKIVIIVDAFKKREERDCF
nr:hypothetical protein [Tanacetum cinerariifolium]